MTKQIKVLMVDDERRFRETTRKLLTKKGFETILADSGEQALKKIKEEPDVVILDIKMSGMDGHKALEEIKKTHPALPVIMLTGHGGRLSAREALIQGAFDYLSKPCDIDILSEKIKEACQEKDPASEQKEKPVLSVMIPIIEYSAIDETQTIEAAVKELKQSFQIKLATNRLLETGHRSVLVKGKDDEIKGILTIKDLLEMVLPEYLFSPKPSLADSIEYSPMFWEGMFSKRIAETKDKCIKDVMSPSPAAIDGGANLMEAAYRMVDQNQRRLLVTLAGKAMGIIREQDLFFEMEKILNRF